MANWSSPCWGSNNVEEAQHTEFLLLHNPAAQRQGGMHRLKSCWDTFPHSHRPGGRKPGLSEGQHLHLCAGALQERRLLICLSVIGERDSSFPVCLVNSQTTFKAAFGWKVAGT